VSESTASTSTSAIPAGPQPHWHRPDPVGDVLAVARQPGLPEPREIRVRPELYARLLAELDPGARAEVEARGVIGGPVGVRLVVAPGLPVSPGFEVVRAGAGAAA
jgi:hypothetical protein